MTMLILALLLIVADPGKQIPVPNTNAHYTAITPAPEKIIYLVQAAEKETNKAKNDGINPAIIAAIISGLVILIANILILKSNSAALKDRKNEDKRKEVMTKLNDFFGPFQQLLKKSQELHEIFRADKPKDFRALTYFLNPTQLYEDGRGVELSRNDIIIFNEIVEVEKLMEDLILTKAGLVEDQVLRSNFKNLMNGSKTTDVSGITNNGLLPVFATHIFVMRMAYEGKIQGDVDKYSRYVFPKELPPAIERNILELNRKLAQLTE